ncbi:pyridoxamine 5'-phosphate oxidase family protein [Allopontixanthobacter sp.]|uniref:pyridoxamine 5'-phosphate oxidase family protein n=1 Tax=Allopontixanthobacter sp. TaxID=2906452 RepID=UPI002ABB1613|nr:pyridoxamine 5'-phosphate oxidase family protein [Allopontixanthobacter sp.]MDZ4307214.1 pyridoxamine 5'-phosphate oxidase family protein [Allopontixanthobacter sp.]
MPDSQDSDEIVFTRTIRDLQVRNGSRDSYAKMEARGGWSDVISPQLAQFIAQQNSFYLATANASGQPYIQHRGGPRGFLKVLDAHTLGMADFRGNRQFISQGNLLDNAKAFIFLMDYANRRRIKIWGEARMVEGDAELIAQLMPEDYAAAPERALLFTVTAWDPNCPQHIPRKYDQDQVDAMLAEKDAEIARLVQEIARVTGSSGQAERGVGQMDRST